MNWPTASKPDLVADTRPVIELDGVSVRYRLPQERIPSFKEYAIRWVRRQISYNEFWALRHVNVSVERGEVFGIIGQNGAGKSTLLKVVARVLRPTEGRVRVRGRVAPLLELGAGFDMELTGRENIALNAAILGYSAAEIEESTPRIIEFAGLKEFIDAPLRTYSTGMVARLGFAVATDRRPEILIVDEILSVGDAEFQTRSFERIQSFQGQGTTILLVSHSLGRIEEMCSRALWLEHGQVRALGSARAVVNQYLGRVTDQEAERLAQEKADQDAAVTESPNRWGTRQVEIERYWLTGADGQEKAVFHTGETLQLHMAYYAPQPVDPPIFGVAIHNNAGVHITGPNTAFAGLDLPSLHGRGVVTYTIPALPLLEGLYQFSMAVVKGIDHDIFDYHDRVLTFRIVNPPGSAVEQYGIVSLDGDWSHTLQPAAQTE